MEEIFLTNETDKSSVKTKLTLFYLLTLATCFGLDQSIIRPLTQKQIAGIM